MNSVESDLRDALSVLKSDPQLKTGTSNNSVYTVSDTLQRHADSCVAAGNGNRLTMRRSHFSEIEQLPTSCFKFTNWTRSTSCNAQMPRIVDSVLVGKKYWLLRSDSNSQTEFRLKNQPNLLIVILWTRSVATEAREGERFPLGEFQSGSAACIVIKAYEFNHHSDCIVERYMMIGILSYCSDIPVTEPGIFCEHAHP